MKIRLREVEAGDLSLFFTHQQDAKAAALAAFSSRDRAAFDQHWTNTLANPANTVRTIVVDSDVSPESGEQVAGNVCSFTRNGLREVGYWIDRAYWGRGVATAALSAFLRLEQTRPLYAGVAKHNAASLRVLQKGGFTFHADDDSHVILVLTDQG